MDLGQRVTRTNPAIQVLLNGRNRQPIKAVRCAAPRRALPPGPALGRPPGTGAPTRRLSQTRSAHSAATLRAAGAIFLGFTPPAARSSVSRRALRAVARDRLRRPKTRRPLTWFRRLRGRRGDVGYVLPHPHPRGAHRYAIHWRCPNHLSEVQLPLWNDGDFGPGIFGFQDASNITFSNITTNCPRCGGVASPDDGTFDVRAGHWRLNRGIADDLRSAQATADDYARLLRSLRRASQPTKSLTRSQRRRPSGDWLRLSRAHPPGWDCSTFLPPSWLWCSGWCHRLAGHRVHDA